MQVLRTGAFATLFSVTFAVAATFQVALAILGLLFALLVPHAFNMNGQPATNPAQAVGVLIFLLVVALIFNAAISACGSGLWIAVRGFILKTKAETPQN